MEVSQPRIICSGIDFLRNEMNSIQASFTRFTHNLNAMDAYLDNIEISYNDAMSKLKGMLQLAQNVQDFIYEEEDYYTEDYLTAEDYVFTASIINPAFTGIYLSSTFPYYLDCQMLPALAFLIKGPHSVLHYSILLHDLFLLHNYYNLNSTIPIHNNNLYRILVWDPGIFQFQ